MSKKRCPEHSTRSVPSDRGHRAIVIATELPTNTFLQLIARSPLLQTQVNFMWVRGREVIRARLFLRRCLGYSVAHRHCTPLVSSQQRDKTSMKRNLKLYVQRMWDRKKTPVPGTSHGRQNPSKTARARPTRGKETVRIPSGPLDSPAKSNCVDYVHVLVYPSGESYQVMDMAILESKRDRQPGHACLLCPMRCDSLVHLIRHLEGLHPGVGCEYDPELKRLYVWFAPEQEFRRKPVAGFLDHWGLMNWRHDGLTHYQDHQPVIHWIGKRYVRPKDRVIDTLPVYNRKNLLTVFGIPVTPIRHHLHTNTTQLIRPDHSNIVDHDSVEEEDQYERDQINNFSDCSPQLMCLWNSFIRPYKPVHSGELGDILYRFAERLAEVTETAETYAPVCAHVSVLRRLRCITLDEAMQVFRVYRAVKNCDGLRLEKLKKT